MFKRSDDLQQFSLFSSGNSLFSGKSLQIYETPTAWHNQFRDQVTFRIDEDLFKPLYSDGQGAPNASIRVMVSMMVLKESQGLSDEKLFESCRFNMLTRSALGLVNMDDSLPTESTYYLFRKKVNDYAKEANINLFDSVFSSITQEQSLEFNVSGKRIRMDSKLLGSNIAWLSRYELAHESLRLFYKEVRQSVEIDPSTREQLDELLKYTGSKVVYSHSSSELTTKLQEVGCLIHKVLNLFSLSKACNQASYQTLNRVFEEQFKMTEAKCVVPRQKEEISSKSIQSPHDTDCHFRNKDGNKVKGYSINLTESCDDDKELNLIGHVDVREATSSDVDFFQDGVKGVQDVFPDKAEAIHADGAYHSPDNQDFCADNEADLYLHAIQGARGRYRLELDKHNNLKVLDTKTNEFVEVTTIKGKNDRDKWRINTDKGYRYFTQKEIDTHLIRNKIEQTPVALLQKRNNVEASIFQLGFHYPNAKSRYRGLVKHQMWATMRCLWVNFVRLFKWIRKTAEEAAFFGKTWLQQCLNSLILILTGFVQAAKKKNSTFYENLKCAA